MKRSHVLLACVVGQFAVSGLILTTPMWVPPVLDASSPEAAHDSAERAVLVTSVIAGALAAAGAMLLLALAWRERSEVAWPLAVIIGLGVVAAIIAASPWADKKVVGAVDAAYADGGFLRRSDSVDQAWPTSPDDEMPLFTGTRTFADTTAPMEVGPFHANAGDTWSVWVSVKGRGWEGDAQPTLLVNPPAQCEVARVDDFRSESGSGIGVQWRCVVLTSGDARIQAILPESSDGTGGIHLSVVPSFDLVMVASLTDSLTALSAALAASALGARAVAQRAPLATR